MAQHPDLDAIAASLPRSRPPTLSASQTTKRQPSGRVLFADASEVSRAVAALQLKHLGYSVDGVSNLPALREAMSSTRYGVILVADNLRVDSDLELSSSRARILYLTHTTPRPEQTPSWVDGILLKPLTLRILSRALNGTPLMNGDPSNGQ